METVYVGLDMGSSGFQQVAIKTDGSIKVNRSFTTSEANICSLAGTRLIADRVSSAVVANLNPYGPVRSL